MGLGKTLTMISLMLLKKKKEREAKDEEEDKWMTKSRKSLFYSNGFSYSFMLVYNLLIITLLM